MNFVVDAMILGFEILAGAIFCLVTAGVVRQNISHASRFMRVAPLLIFAPALAVAMNATLPGAVYLLVADTRLDMVYPTTVDLCFTLPMSVNLVLAG